MATIYADARLVVTADWTDGELVIYGQDLGPARPGGEEYEYWLTIPKAQLHLVASDVGAAANDEEGLMDQLIVHGKRIVEMGESTWLTALGVTARSHNWF